MKKILSMILVLCMALTLCSAAFAEGKSPVDGMTGCLHPEGIRQLVLRGCERRRPEVR